MMPKGWKMHRIKDVSKVTTGSTPLRSNNSFFTSNGGIPWVKTLDLNNSFITATHEQVTQEALSKTSLKIYPPNTVLVAMYGGFNQIGRTGLLKIEAATNQAISAIQPSEFVDALFLIHYLNANVRRWKNFAASSRKDPNITKSDVEDFEVLLPPKSEQEKIAKILSTWDEAIEKLNVLIKTKNRNKSYYMLSALNPDQSGWKTYRVFELGDITKGKGIAKSEVTETGIPCVRYGEIYTTHNTVIRAFRSYIQRGTAKESKRLAKGDLVFAGSGETAEEIGKCIAYLGDDEAYVGGDTMILSPFGHSSLFLSYLFNSSYTRKQLNVLGQGNAVVHLYPRDLANVTVSVPDFKQQIKIAAYLNSLDEEMLIYEKIVDRLRVQKNGLMQQLLTGKKRVKI